MKSPTSLINFRNAVGAMLALSAIFAVVISSVTISHERAFADSHTTVTLAGPTANPTEGTAADITVSLSGATTSDVVVPLKITPGTAAVTADYTVPDPSSVTITSTSTNNGETFSVPTVNDAVYEPQQTFTVSLDTENSSWPTGFSAGDTSSVTITINDDDSADPTGTVVIRVKNADDTYADLDTSDPPAQITDFVPSSGHVLHADTADATTPIIDTDQPLTADTTDPADARDAPSFKYQWIRTNDGSTTADDADEAIAGATSSTYTVTDEDVGDLITVQVWSSDRLDNGNGNASAAVVDTDPDPDVTVIAAGTNGFALAQPTARGAVDYDEAKPFIIIGALPDNARAGLDDGDLTPGVELTADHSGIFRLDSTDSSLKLVGSDGEFVTVDLDNDPTTDVGGTKVGFADANATFSWQRNGTTIESTACGTTLTDTTAEPCVFTYNAAGTVPTGVATYTLTDDDVSETITLVLTYDTRSAVGSVGDANYAAAITASVASDALGHVYSTNRATGMPSITGKTQVGSTLTASKGTIADADGSPAEADITYYWVYGEDWDRRAETGGITHLHIGSTYLLGAKDAGKTLIVRARFMDGLGDPDVRTSDPTNTVAGSPGMISKVEPAIRGITVSGGDTVVLSVNIYGLQDKMDNSLAGTFSWSVNDVSVDGSGRELSYTAPSSPSTYMVKAMLADGDCAPDDETMRASACSATFEVKVRRPSATQPADEAPANPPGDIPTILADSDGNQYEVFTPVEGGTFDGGEGYSVTAAAGAVPNGEFIGVRMSDDGSASNAGMTHQRYTLGGNMYGVHAVDSTGAAISSYALDDAATVCVPLPDELRSNISDLAVVAINGDGSLTILSAQVKITSSGAMVCGNLSNLPASVAVGSAGAPAAIPTATPEPTPEPPATGGTAPASSGNVLWALLLGVATLALGTTLVIARRREGSRKS